MNKFKRKFKISTFFRLYILIAIPALIVITMMLITNIFYTRQYRDSLEKNYISSMQSAYRENENAIQSTISGINMLAHNEKFMSAIKNGSISTEQSSYLTDTIRLIEQQNDSIYNILIIDRARNIVNTSFGKSAVNSYFLYKCNYRDYDEKYWMEYKAPLSGTQRLSPTIISEGETIRSVIPVVFTQIGEKRISQLLIVNIDISKLLNKMQNYKFTENSKFFIISNQNGQVFNYASDNTEIIDGNLYNKIIKDKFYSSKMKGENGKPNMVISIAPSNSMLGYSYLVMIPYNDINRNLRSIVLLFAGFMVIVVAGVLLFSYKNASEINEKLRDIADVFKSDKLPEKDDGGLDLVEYIRKSVNNAIYMQNELKNDLVIVMPLAVEKYLLNLLNNNDDYVDVEMEKIARNFIGFRHDYFVAVIAKIDPTQLYYEEYSNEEDERIKSGIYEVIKTIFSDLYSTYIIPSEDDTIIIILNIKDIGVTKQIDDTINNVAGFFENDKDYVRFAVGVGGAYQDIAGLKRSYKEAQSSMKNKEISMQVKQKEDTAKAALINKSSDKKDLCNYIAENDITEVGAVDGNTDIIKIINYINENYCSVLSLDILADKFKMNPKYISKRIKEYMGITFVDYVAALRINRAKELLLETDKTISEIYMETGFNNRNTFVRTFKKCYGGKPSEYRAKNNQ